jgi:hypothetical protein
MNRPTNNRPSIKVKMEIQIKTLNAATRCP